MSSRPADPQVVVLQLRRHIEPLIREQNTEELRQLILQRCLQQGATDRPDVVADGSSLVRHFISHTFVPECLVILDQLMHALASEQTTILLDKNMPVLSINDLRIVYTVTELLWTWGLEQSVSHYSTFNGLAVSSTPKSILIQRKALESVSSCLTVTPDFDYLYRIAACLKRVTFNDMFASLMVERSLDRIILSCLVLSNRTLMERASTDICPVDPSKTKVTGSAVEPRMRNDVANMALQMLNEIRDSSYCSLVVTRARVFLRCQHWLRDAACLFLSSILGQRNGLQATLTGYLDGEQAVVINALQVDVALECGPRYWTYGHWQDTASRVPTSQLSWCRLRSW